jgi:thioesterase domain-containing protein
LAKLIEGGDPERSWRCLVPIRAAGSKSPLYLMHYLEGSIGHYYNLANRLPPDQPVFGVQAPPAPLDSIEAMASRYLDEIRGRQPRGPYRLGGFCIGGMLAFEMARQLAAQDETVLPLILLDCVAPGPLFAKSNTVLPSAGTLTRMALADPQAFAGRVSKRLVRSVRRFGRASDDAAKPVELHDVRDMSSLPQAYVEPSICHFRAGRDYHPDPWDGDAILLRTDDERFGGDLGWSRWVRGNLEITLIPGSHVDTLKEPIVQETGRLVAAALDHPASSAFTPKS